ncbi:transposase [Paraburkholderia sp. HP33-1]|uniref:transposase n=1 Tax=Paraburkholderia sp. HP33-1 TaxID=2883243 RepID=UPI003FA37A64
MRSINDALPMKDRRSEAKRPCGHMHSDRDDRETSPWKQTGGWPKPGVSIARAAMDHDVNPNQLRRWISRHLQHMLLAPGDPDPVVIDGVSIDVPGPRVRSPVNMSSPPAFVPVVSSPVLVPLSPPVSTSPGLSMAIALHVISWRCTVLRCRRTDRNSTFTTRPTAGSCSCKYT